MLARVSSVNRNNWDFQIRVLVKRIKHVKYTRFIRNVTRKNHNEQKDTTRETHVISLVKK